MDLISVEDQGAVALVRLQNNVTNAINPQLLEELLEAIAMIEGSFGGLVLAGGSKFFCIGLDLPALLNMNRRQMDAFWDRFDLALMTLYGLPMPSAAAIAGHATAGGAILALTQDFRYVAEGRNLIGLNEVNIGLPVPFLADLMLRQIVGERTATKLMFGGELISPHDAYRSGLVDDVRPENDLERHTVDKIAELAQRPRKAFSIIKQNRTMAVLEQFRQQQACQKQALLDCWFDADVQQMLHKAAEKF